MKSTKGADTGLPLKGTLAKLPWVTVTRASKSDSKSPRKEEVVHSVRSSEEIAEAFGRRPRDPHEP